MISNKPWGDVSESDYKDADSFCKACLVDLNAPGADKIKSLCKLPVYEPGGALNRNAVHAAAARFGQTRIPTDEKKKAARKLIARYRELDEDVPDSIMVAAGVR